MNAQKLTTWLSLGANLGVLVGLILLVIEIRQNTNMMESQIHQSRTEAALSEQQAVFNSDHMPAILVKVANGEPLTEEESRRFEPYFRAFNRNMDNQLWQFNRGFLGDNIPRSVGNAVPGVIGESQLGMELWQRMKVLFTDEYVVFVDSVLRGPARTP
ncbi:MAG TPA: hypothetical protein VMM35_04600 [Longimicrobiales bacterium]|nr:hypothetical protein [Longimicrobiales bacterium]